MLNYVPIDAVVTFDVVTHDPDTGNVRDADSVPVYDVFEDVTDTPILSAQNTTKRTSKTGDYRGNFTCSAANGFDVDKSYNVVASATVTGTVSGNAITAKKVALTFRAGLAAVTAGSVPATVAGSVASVLGGVGGNVAGSVASVVDLSVTANTELTAVPASTATVKDMIKWVFMAARNRRTQTSTTQLIKANDGSTTVGTSAVSDDTVTAVRGVFT